MMQSSEDAEEEEEEVVEDDDDAEDPQCSSKAEEGELPTGEATSHQQVNQSCFMLFLFWLCLHVVSSFFFVLVVGGFLYCLFFLPQAIHHSLINSGNWTAEELRDLSEEREWRIYEDPADESELGMQTLE